MNDIDFYIDTVFDNVDTFDCGFKVFNDYLRNQGEHDCAVIHYIVNSENDELIAYFSLLSSALLFGNLSNLSAIPAIELKMFAVNRQYQKSGLAKKLLGAIEITINDYAREYVGAKIILLYSVPVERVVNLYSNFGFQKLDSFQIAYKSYFNEGCIPMFKPIN